MTVCKNQANISIIYTCHVSAQSCQTGTIGISRMKKLCFCHFVPIAKKYLQKTYCKNILTNFLLITKQRVKLKIIFYYLHLSTDISFKKFLYLYSQKIFVMRISLFLIFVVFNISFSQTTQTIALPLQPPLQLTSNLRNTEADDFI